MENYQSLSKLHSAKDSDIQIITEQMRDYFGHENDRNLKIIAEKLEIHPELAASFNSSSAQKEIEALNMQKLKSLFASDEKFVEIYTNLQIELIKKAGDRLIASRMLQYEGEQTAQAMQIKAALTKFAQMKITEMSETFQKSKQAFGKRRKEQREEAQQYKDDEYYYNILMQSLDQEAAFFFNTIEESQKGFIEAITEKAEWRHIG